MTDTLSRRFVTVAAPTVLAAIGEVLRRAFGRPASNEFFEKIIAKIDRS